MRFALRTKMEVASSPAFTRLSSPLKSSVTPEVAGKLSDDRCDYSRVGAKKCDADISLARKLGSSELDGQRLLVRHQCETEYNPLVPLTFFSACASLPLPIPSSDLCKHLAN